MENLTHIQIFKTNIKTADDKIKIAAALCTMAGIEEWSVDCEDIDCVLRVVSYTLSPSEIIKLITRTGFQCEELE